MVNGIMKYLCVFDSWKGCMDSDEANLAARQGILDVVPSAEVVSLRASDGGEGMLEAFLSAMGGHKAELLVHDPLMRPIKAEYGIAGDTAIIEVARACGLTLLTADERNPMLTTSYGVGEFVLDAYRKGCRQFIIGLGGSGTSDAGIGMLQALLQPSYFGVHNQPARDKSTDTFSNLHSLILLFEQNAVNNSLSYDLFNNKSLQFILASDVQNHLFGDNGAAQVFAPQKGATPEMVAMLDAQAQELARWAETVCGHDCSHNPGAGAAGGLGYAFMQFLGAKSRSGIDLLLDAYHFEHLLEGADYVLTGEGSADRQTLMGKLPFGVMRRATAKHVPTLLFSGLLRDESELLKAGFAKAVCINPPSLPLSEAIKKSVAMNQLRKKVKETMSS